MFAFGTTPRIRPFRQTAAPLYVFPCQITGIPMSATTGTPTVPARICASVSSASRMSLSVRNRSPQVYPVTASSGNVTICAPDAAAFFISRTICAPLCAVSATAVSGIAAARVINPY